MTHIRDVNRHEEDDHQREVPGHEGGDGDERMLPPPVAIAMEEEASEAGDTADLNDQSEHTHTDRCLQHTQPRLELGRGWPHSSPQCRQ